MEGYAAGMARGFEVGMEMDLEFESRHRPVVQRFDVERKYAELDEIAKNEDRRVEIGLGWY